MTIVGPFWVCPIRDACPFWRLPPLARALFVPFGKLVWFGLVASERPFEITCPRAYQQELVAVDSNRTNLSESLDIYTVIEIEAAQSTIKETWIKLDRVRRTSLLTTSSARRPSRAVRRDNKPELKQSQVWQTTFKAIEATGRLLAQ